MRVSKLSSSIVVTHKIAILIPYFGGWPSWINFFIESCRWNQGMEWFLFSDQSPPENRSPNVRHIQIGFEQYKDLVSEALGIRFNPSNPYKLCDVKPALPYVHQELLRSCNFVGFGDLDVIYGNIRSFYDNELLSNYDLLSTHADRISGHLCLMRNDDLMISAFKRIPRWAKLMSQELPAGIDEREFYNIFRGRRAKVADWFGHNQPRCYFHEAYSTPGATAEMRWHWKAGRLTNDFYPHHPFMYLHFMSWHSNRWYKEQAGVPSGMPSPWSMLPELVQMDWREARERGFLISPHGIQPLDRARCR
jgi:hypothetical protein